MMDGKWRTSKVKVGKEEKGGKLTMHNEYECSCCRISAGYRPSQIPDELAVPENMSTDCYTMFIVLDKQCAVLFGRIISIVLRCSV